jgi:predicted lipoprotein
MALSTLLALALMLPAACSDPTPENPNPNSEEIAAVLQGYGERAILPALERFRTAVIALEDATTQWAQTTEEEQDSAAAKSAAQAQYLETMAIWQEIEVHQLGPTKEVRDEVFSFPTTNPCRIDQETTEENWNNEDFFSSNNVNSYGLDGLEVLLFSDDSNHCSGQLNPNADGSWDALGPDGVERNRARFSVALSAGLRTQADSLLQGWGPEGADFADILANPGPDAVYTNEQEALNGIYEALFYLELGTKDRKLALPLGLKECTGELCAEQVEGKLSESSMRWIESNLEGFWSLYTGGEGLGVDDLLRELGHGDLADRFQQAFDAAYATVQSLEGNLYEMILDDRETAESLLAELKVLTDLLKGDLSTVLTLTIPNEAAGDND